ncbi:TonB-dependent receptor [Longimonas halophila]|uniref:TonB-dependent receptor n=1 Tax=Longimonas halophila TaxID=1469170 RepID=UPI001596572A|nr:TonB-dependent receptor [Longimonas halophila]
MAASSSGAWAQGVTTATIRGFVTDASGEPLPGANVVAVHEPSGTEYGVSTRSSGTYTIQNARVGGPYTVTASFVGFAPQTEEGITLNLGETFQLNFELTEQDIALDELTITADSDDVMNSERTGAVTSVDPAQVARLPSIDRSTRDLIRTDPRNDGNLSFGGRNWLFNNLSVDGSYFNNPYGLDDPSPGGQANAEPIPFESVEQVQVSVAPFDVRQGGFTGANVNTVTKSGSNEFSGSLYTFYRDENFQGNTVSGNEVIANPDLTFNQTGFTASGPIVEDKLFFFVNGEISRREDPGTDFVADTDGTVGPGESRVREGVMEDIRQRMIDVYDYNPGRFQDYLHATDNDKLLLKLNWNISTNHDLSLRYNYLDARRDLGPNPVAISFNGTGRGPNEQSLPFENAGYRINNQLNSFALELNSRGDAWSNRFFSSYNRFRDFREPFSTPFPTIEIGQDGTTYTTVGHEPFSINNILDQDVLQVTNNFSYFAGRHVLTGGANFELFSFFNSFNLFRHGQFGFLELPNTFPSVDNFFDETDPSDPADLRGLITPESVPFKGEFIDVGQLAFYVQDEYAPGPRLNLTFGLRVDFPLYFTDPVDNPFSRGLTALDENDNPTTVDQSQLPDVTPLWSPRIGFNWDVFGDRTTQVRGGTGIFTGRIPFVWIGNVISNPGANPNLFSPIPGVGLSEDEIPEDHFTQDGAVLQQSFDLNGVVSDFKWPQVWTTNIGIDQRLPGGFIATIEGIYGNDRNAIVMRNFDLGTPSRFLQQDGRPYFGAAEGENELNPDGAGIYTLDNTNEGYNLNVTAELKKEFASGLYTSVAYSYTRAESQLKTTEIASALWQELPVQGDPNDPNLANSEFGIRHRISGSANYRHVWGSRDRFATTIGAFFSVAEGNQFTVGGGNRYSYIYSGDVNGDGSGSNDLIYIPESPDEITLADPSQWDALDAFIEQDDYLSENRGQIAERFGAVNPWFANLDLRIMQDVAFEVGGAPQRFQLSLDILNVPNLLNSDWGVRKVARASATSPLEVATDADDNPIFDSDGDPVLNFVGPESTYTDDPNLLSRWRMQLGIKYIFN